MPDPRPVIRTLEPTDSIAELTRLLNAAYRQLLDLGLRYVATWQDEGVTRRRLEGNECWVAVEGDRLVGTITLHPPGGGKGHPHYERVDVAAFSQFGVRPGRQGAGLGSALLARVEARAREMGAKEIACDTAEPATHLRAYYEHRGYRVVGRADWDMVNYESVILSKVLSGP